MQQFVFAVLFFFSSSINFMVAQESIAIPFKGFSNVPIIVGESTIADVKALYGEPSKHYESERYSELFYEEKGLKFRYHPYDKNEIIRSIIAIAPFQTKTENGIVMGKTTMQEVLDFYNAESCHTFYDHAYFLTDGIKYFIENEKRRKGYDVKKKISRIEIKGEDSRFEPKKNFEFNQAKADNLLGELIVELSAPIFNPEQIRKHFDFSKSKNPKPYTFVVKSDFKRNLVNGTKEERIKFRFARGEYVLNYIYFDNILIGGFLHEKKYSLKDKKIHFKKKLDLSLVENDIYVSLNEEFDVFGTGCGVAGTPTKGYEEIQKLVAKNDITKIKELLFSLDPEAAAFGYYGFKVLESKGTNIPFEVSQRMKLLHDKKVVFEVCEGCIYGDNKDFSYFDDWKF